VTTRLNGLEEALRLILSNRSPTISQIGLGPGTETAMVALKRIDLNGTNTNDTIVAYETQYLVKVCGRWRAGTFDRQWYGLNFSNYGSEGIELEAIDEVYAITEDAMGETSALPLEYLQNV
jgi:hypothetical protein